MAEGKAKWKGTGVENSSYRAKQTAMDQASSSQKLITASSYLPLSNRVLNYWNYV